MKNPFNFLIVIIIIFVGLLIADYKFCVEDKSEYLGIATHAEEIPTSFNDSHRMKIDIKDTKGDTGIYFIRGISNIKNGQDIYMVTTTCGAKRIKIGEKLFKTYENN